MNPKITYNLIVLAPRICKVAKLRASPTKQQGSREMQLAMPEVVAIVNAL